MSYPNIPDVKPKIDICGKDVVNLLLASIAFEELGLAHLINAEAEKVQFVLGTLDDEKPRWSARADFDDDCDKGKGHKPAHKPSVEDLIKINKTVEQTLRTIIKKEMLLQFKLEDTLSIMKKQQYYD